MAAHFHSEEEILRQQGFPGLAEHAANHAKLSERAKILQKQSDDRGISVGELVDFLVVEVITKHILQEDRTYFQCFGGGSEPSHEDSAQPAGAC
jgi:hemerythrin-like metal-binding protein